MDAALIEDLRDRASAGVARWRPGTTITAIEPLTGGASSLTFIAWLSGAGDLDRVVLKVAPPGLPPVKNRDVLRQGRLMRALHGRPGVPVPEVHFSDAGVPPEVPPFLAMGFVPGTCTEPVLLDSRDPALFADHRARGLDAARVLGALHRLDPVNVGLDETAVTLSAEVERWTIAFGTLPEDLRGAFEPCAARLVDTMPAPAAPVVNHGDYRVGNTLCLEGRVTAVIDWEIWSVGDPRVDTSWMLYFTDEARHPAAPTDAPSGMATADQLLDAYRSAGGATLDDLHWFHALTRYKEAAATGLLLKRARKLGGELAPSMARMVPALPRLLDEVHKLLG